MKPDIPPKIQSKIGKFVSCYCKILTTYSELVYFWCTNSRTFPLEQGFPVSFQEKSHQEKKM